MYFCPGLSEPLYKCIGAYGYGTVEKRSQLVRQFESRDREFKVKLLKNAVLFLILRSKKYEFKLRSLSLT